MTDPPGDRLAWVRGLVDREPPAPDRLGRLCRAASRALPATGVGVSVMTDAGVQGTAAASDRTSSILEDLQFSFNEGPCLDAYALRRPVLTHALDKVALARWPAYTPAAREQGVRAVFAFPIQLGAARLGVLDVYRDAPGGLSRPELSQALAFADAAMELLLDEQQGAATGTSPTAEAALDDRAEVFQAQGMVMMQLGVTLEESMARLRAYAFAYDRSLSDVARDVVARRLRMESDVPPGDGLDTPGGPADA